MYPIQAIITCFSKYGTFSGRALRSEFWWFILFANVSVWIASIVDVWVWTSGIVDATGVATLIVALVMIIPFFAVSARRLHDTGRSGWWYLLAFTIIGTIPLLVLWAIKGDAGANQYGPPPR